MHTIIARPGALLGVVLLSAAACTPDRVGPMAPEAAVFPSVLGSYAGTATVTGTTEFGVRESASCPIRIDVLSQTDAAFSGGFVLSGGDCDPIPGTLNGTVQESGTLSVFADAEGGGANVFEDAAARAGCTLVSSSGTLNGAIVGTQLTLQATAAYDCPTTFGDVRVNVSGSVTASRT